jgi:hypothetical protein
MLFNLLVLVFIYSGCGNGDGSDEAQPCLPILFHEVYPPNNAANEPVLLHGEGFNENTSVNFGSIEATVFDLNENFISTRVPSGLNGLVEIILRNGEDCIQSKDFEVISQLPAGLPVSPPVYVIPTAGFAFPLQVGMDETMYLVNVYDDTHRIHLAIFRIAQGAFDIPGFSTEYFMDTENSITGSVDLEANSILMNIDRSGTEFPDDRLEGGFYTLEMEIDDEMIIDNFLIVFSATTGRQYLFR